MRILHFFKTYWPDTFGGVERSIDAIAEHSVHLGAEHHVLSLTPGNPEGPALRGTQTLHKVRRTGSFASTDFSFSCLGPFRRLAAEADIVHLHFPWPFMDAIVLASRVRKPIVLTYHSDALANPVLETAYRPLRDRLLSRVDAIVATSPNYLVSSKVLRACQDKTTIIPLGLDEAAYPDVSAERLQHWKTRFGSDFFLFTGVLRHYKGLETLLRAAAKTHSRIVIAGSGPEKTKLKAQMKQQGLDHVHLVGSIKEEDKVALLRLCSGFAFPSNKRSEAFGLSLVEAAMFGKPMISCDIGTGTSYVNSDGETGFVIPPDDPDALAEKMNVLASDGDLQASFGAAARKRYEEHLRAETMGRRYFELYRQVLNETPR
ncbi:glycosyltransferase [Hoeflea prorocentri]|uniref:Glycosyltransferase n=1 Tax=Hoeflea prorocentri TaxID=1922333 RepID=A0A9X3ZGK8_9HYPH|nr:glycosyltransferase [Hoeflea prorocentri]MCY6379845.1 glycosyltransferase [Hoeflea prorocentri]MDA5397645.1 glycosyltransferase [Hoeflea prorocentri]